MKKSKGGMGTRPKAKPLSGQAAGVFSGAVKHAKSCAKKRKK